MIIDGRAIASEILADVRRRLPAGRTPVVRAVTVYPSPATESYLKTKTARAEEAGMRLEVVNAVDEASVIAAIQKPGADACIVQLPLPGDITQQRVLDAISPSADADVLSSDAYAAFREGHADALLPPVVGAIAEILERANVAPSGKRVVIVGKGRLVGEPAAIWFSRFGAVEVITRESGNLSVLKDADIIVSGAGQAGLIEPSMIKEGVVLIDAGTSESNGAIAGDADPRCAEIASVFTPVPGGVGPIAVACLFKNAASLIAP